MSNGVTTTTVKPTKIDTKILIAVFAVIAFVVAGIAVSYYATHAGQPTSAQVSTSSGPGSPAGPPAPVTTTPVPTATQITVVPQTTEQIRDAVIASSPDDKTAVGIAKRADAVTNALCKQGFKAKTVIFRLYIPGKSIAEETRAGTVVEQNGEHEYLSSVPNTPAYPLGKSDNPIPNQVAQEGYPLYEGAEDLGKYCP